MKTIIGPEDLKPGQLVTIHHGRRDRCDCGCGHLGPEAYERVQGMPMAVAAVCLPYVSAFVVPLQANIVLDIRDCELMRVDEKYARSFAPLPQAAPKDHVDGK